MVNHIPAISHEGPPYSAIMHTLAIEPGPLPFHVTAWDRLVAARQDVVVAAMAEHSALTFADNAYSNWGHGVTTAETVGDALDAVTRTGELLTAAILAANTALKVWRVGVVADLAEYMARDDEDADDLRASRDIDDRSARGEWA